MVMGDTYSVGPVTSPPVKSRKRPTVGRRVVSTPGRSIVPVSSPTTPGEGSTVTVSGGGS